MIRTWGVLTQVRHRCTSQTSAYSAQAHPTVCTVPAVDFTTSRPRIAAKQSPPAPCSMCQGRCGAVWGWGLACKALRRGQSNPDRRQPVGQQVLMMALLLRPFPFFLPVVCLACGGWCWCCCLVVGSGYDVESFYFRVKGFRVKKDLG